MKRGCKQKGDLPDIDKAASIVVDDFRNGRIGRVTLEFPIFEEKEETEEVDETIKEENN